MELTSFQATVVTLSPGDHQLVTQETMARMSAHLVGGASGSHAFGYSYPVGVCLGVLGDVSILSHIVMKCFQSFIQFHIFTENIIIILNY